MENNHKRHPIYGNENPFIGFAIPQYGSDVENPDFEYSYLLNKRASECINRSKAQLEFTRVFNKNKKFDIKSGSHVLIIGKSTVIGSALRRIFQNEAKPFISINGINEFDFTSPTTFQLFSGIEISSVYITYQPPYIRHTHSGASDYINHIIQEYVKGISDYFSSKRIPFIFATTQPLQKEILKIILDYGGNVIEFPFLIDSLAFKDLENPTMRAIRECRKVNYTNIEYFPISEYHSITSHEAAEYIIQKLNENKRNHIIVKGYSTTTIEAAVTTALKSLNLIKCKVNFQTFPHKINTLKQTDKEEYLGKQNVNVLDMIYNTYKNFTRKEKDKTYLTIVASGRNDGYSINFETRLQNFFNAIDYGLMNVPLAQVEVVYVDFGTSKDKQLLSDIIKIGSSLKSHVRFIVVPPEIHTEMCLKLKRNGTFYEFIGKNIGIRRSKSKFILSTNSDNLFSTEFFELIASHQFNQMILYRSFRLNERENTLSDFNLTRNQSIEILPEVWKLNKMNYEELTLRPDTSFYILNEHVKYHQRPLAVDDASGDFIILSKYLWDIIKGFNEVPYNVHVDKMFLTKTMKLLPGILILFMNNNPFVHQYHIRYNILTEYITNLGDLMGDYTCNGTWHNCGLFCENSNWGLGDRKFEEMRK